MAQTITVLAAFYSCCCKKRLSAVLQCGSSIATRQNKSIAQRNKLTFKYYICLLFLLLEGCGFAWLLDLESRTYWLAGCFLCLVGCGFAWCENFVGAVGTSAAVWLVHGTSAAVWLVHVLARLANKA
jgi:hypothetical protein